MELYSSQKGKETYTTADCKKYLKMFFRWLRLGSRSYTEVGDPPETKRVKIQRVQDSLVREDLITEADFTRLIHASKHSRVKAMIAMAYEGGPRPGEALTLRIKHVRFDDLGAVIAVDGKTGARPIRLIKSVPYLLRWLDDHPLRDDKEAPFFCQIQGENIGGPLRYEAARKLLLKVVEDAQLSKRVNLKLFRHSEATELANFMTEAQLRKRHGWSKDSKMPSRYVHLVNADVEEALMKHYGIKKEENKQAKLPKRCNICDTINPLDSSRCSRCGKPLDLQTAMEAEEKLQAEQEKYRIEIDDMRKRLEEIECDRKARYSSFANNMLNCELKDDSAGKIFSILFHVLFEMSASEEEKRRIWKRALEEAEKGERFDLSWLGDPANFSLSNYFGRPVSVQWIKRTDTRIHRSFQTLLRDLV